MEHANFLPDVPVNKVVLMPTVPIHKIVTLPVLQTKKGKSSLSNDDVKKHNESVMKEKKERLAIENALEIKLAKLRNKYYNIL